jgi:hypothetical protein
MSLEAVLARLRGVRRNTNGYMALCPAHTDKHASLSLRYINGRVLMFCFAGCPVESICGALGIRVRDLFSGASTVHKPEPPIVHDVRRQMADTTRSKLTPREREREVTIVLASRKNPVPALARALALAVEGEIVQIAFNEGGE